MQLDLRVDNRPRFPAPSRENLAVLARLAYDLSKHHCGDCRDYHIMWPYLRSLGINGAGTERYWPEQFALLERVIAGRSAVRWLLAGSADAGQLALVSDVMAAHPEMAHTVAVVDRCATPLGLCRAYATDIELPVEIIHSDLMQFERDGGFDIVMMHHILHFFPVELRMPFLAHAGRWLAPDGLLLIAAADRRDDEQTRNAKQVFQAWRESVIRDEAALGTFEPPEAIDRFVARLHGMQDSKKGVGDRNKDLDYYAGLVRAVGLPVAEISKLSDDDARYANIPGNEHKKAWSFIVAGSPRPPEPGGL